MNIEGLVDILDSCYIQGLPCECALKHQPLPINTKLVVVVFFS